VSALHSIRKHMKLTQLRQDAERQLDERIGKDDKLKQAIAKPGARAKFLKQVMTGLVEGMRKKRS
jgi:hypothetical protein